MATVALRLWPFHDSSVALSHRRRAQTGKRKRLYGVFRPPFPHNRQATSGVSKLNARISMTRKCRVYSYLLPITQLLISCLIQVSFSSICLIHSAAHGSKRKTWKYIHGVRNATIRNDSLRFYCYLCHVRCFARFANMYAYRLHLLRRTCKKDIDANARNRANTFQSH